MNHSNRFILSFKILIPDNLKIGSASYKAPADILSIAKNEGFKEFPIKIDYKYGRLIRLFTCIFQLVRFSYSIPKRSVVIYQYPEFHPVPMLLAITFCRKWYSISVIHDINSFRNNGCLSWTEKKLLAKFDVLIVHTEAMLDYLANLNGIVGPNYFVLDAFPYLAQIDETIRNKGLSVCFPGNIDKSKFIPQLLKKVPCVKLELYGNLKTIDLSMYENALYHGFFRPDNVIGLKGSWGLVWDGDSIEKCSGNYGNYQKIIAPHKFSLFIVAGLPVIVWKRSAMAKIVENMNIGICVENLCNLETILSSISEEKYQEFRDNVYLYANIISEGDNFRKILGKL